MLVHLFLLDNVFVFLHLIILLNIVNKLSKNAVNVLFRIQESNNVVNSFVPTANKITQPPLLSALLVRERTLSRYVWPLKIYHEMKQRLGTPLSSKF